MSLLFSLFGCLFAEIPLLFLKPEASPDHLQAFGISSLCRGFKLKV